jgi:acetate kinase
MKVLKRMSYTKIYNKLNKLGYECYRITKEEINLEGFTSGLFGIKGKEDYQLILRKYKNSNMYVVELDCKNKNLIDYTKKYFKQFSNIDYIMINGGK